MRNELLKEGPRKKVEKPSQRKVMAQWAVYRSALVSFWPGRTFGASETSYRYQPALKDENEEIVNCLLRLTTCHKRWGSLAYAFLFAECEGFWMESQTGISYLPWAGIKFTN